MTDSQETGLASPIGTQSRVDRARQIHEENEKKYGKGSKHRVQLPSHSVRSNWKCLNGVEQTTTWRNGVRKIELPKFEGP